MNAGAGEIAAHWICENTAGQLRAGILKVLDDDYCVRSIIAMPKDGRFSAYLAAVAGKDVRDDSGFAVLDASTAYFTLMHGGRIIRGAVHDPAERSFDLRSQTAKPSPDRLILDVEHELSARLAPCLLTE